MKRLIENPFFNKGFPQDNGIDKVSTDVEAVRKLLALCPKASRTPLVSSIALAEKAGVKNIWFKDERQRMGLGSFKALGAAYVIADHASKVVTNNASANDWKKALNGKCYVTASAGNHGLSLAAGARLFGAKAVIYLSSNVPSSFANKIKSYGADVVILGNSYEESMEGAQKAASDNNWMLLSDVTWDGYDAGLKVMEGYLVAAAEAYEDCPELPTHIFLQAGVGGFPAAMAAQARRHYGNDPKIIIVEPTEAPVLLESIQAGKGVEVKGDVSIMGRLDCKVPSTRALSSLAKTCTHFMTITDEDAENCMKELENEGLETSPSGGAGYAGLIDLKNHHESDLTKDSNVVIFLTEGPA
tara:strand:+ start:2392 stop:3462 length:1071 start_codon:yes stop_codon:yes gene_type:complete